MSDIIGSVFIYDQFGNPELLMAGPRADEVICKYFRLKDYHFAVGQAVWSFGHDPYMIGLWKEFNKHASPPNPIPVGFIQLENPL